MSNTNSPVARCDFCNSLMNDFVYSPIGTRREMKVYVCENCGLTQSIQGKDEEQKIRTLSTDANWGNVRHGKGVRFQSLRGILEKKINWKNIDNALDIGSNRGDFIFWLEKYHPKIEVTAVEPDQTVTFNYRNLSQTTLFHERLENLSLPLNHFDFVFCSHTLEHATSASAMLKYIFNMLRPGGLFLLEVPNITGISSIDVVEEFFIDKHTFHFDRETLINFLESIGFSIEIGKEDTDSLNITLLLKRSKSSNEFRSTNGDNRAVQNKTWINNFSHQLLNNRILLKKIVTEKLHPLGKRQKVGYWGAGRIFDALVQYGELNKNDVYCLVDGYLHGLVKETHGIYIDRPENLRLHEPQVLVALGRSAEEFMAKTAYQFGIRHVIKFSELIAQVRNF